MPAFHDPAARGPGAIGTAGHHRYEPVEVLGRGGMAEVRLAMLRAPGGFTKLVVRKTLHKHLRDDRIHVEMFLEEGWLAARLNHPNVVQTVDVGTEDGTPYIAMEFIEGVPYVELVRLRGDATLPLAAHLAILCDALAGLHHAHELIDFDGRPLAVVHCDVSPHNVIVTCAGTAKLLDFGVARTALTKGEGGPPLARGKCTYMAPEQLAGRGVDRRADVFSVGIMLWEAITGERLWGRSTKNTALQVLEDEIPDVRAFQPDAHPTLARICARALARRPADRFATAAEMARELEVFLGQLGGARASVDLASRVEQRFAARRALLAGKVRDVSSQAPRAYEPTTRAADLDTEPGAPLRPTFSTRLAATIEPASFDVLFTPGPRSRSLTIFGLAMGVAVLVAALRIGPKPPTVATAAAAGAPVGATVDTRLAPAAAVRSAVVSPSTASTPASPRGAPPAPAPASSGAARGIAAAARSEHAAPSRGRRRSVIAVAPPATDDGPLDLENPY